MAMETSYDHLITQFSDTLHIRAQQMRARLRPYVQIRKMTGDNYAYDGLGTVEAREIFGRFNQVVFDDIEHFRRKIGRRRFTVTIPVDDMDLEGFLTDPTGQYAQQTVHALERVFDRVCYESMFADVATGRDFSTSVSYTADGVLTVNATGGLTLAKWLEIDHNFLDNEVGNDMPVERVVGVSGDEHSTLLQIQEFTNLFYSRGYALEKGQLVNAAGINIVKFGASTVKPLLAVSGGVRTSFALATNGLCVGMGREPRIKVEPRPDMHDTKQVNITTVLGCVRTEGKLLQKLTTTDL